MANPATNLVLKLPLLAIILMQFGYAGMSILAKYALDQGMSEHVLVVYRHAIATLVTAPFALSFERPAIDKNVFYSGMKLTTATFASTLSNILPVFSFLMAWLLRLENVNLKTLHGWAKILGTMVIVGGAMIITMINGPFIDLYWNKGEHFKEFAQTEKNPIKGALLIVFGCFSSSCFTMLQAITLKSYTADLSLTTLICLAGSIEGTGVAIFFERKNPSAWSIHFDWKLLAAVYGGVICSGLGYYLQGLIMKLKGPVFVLVFGPLSIIITAIMSSLLLSETMGLGRIWRAIVIIVGLYIFLWGKSKDQATTGQDFPNMSDQMHENTTGATHICPSNERLDKIHIFVLAVY